MRPPLIKTLQAVPVVSRIESFPTVFCFVLFLHFNLIATGLHVQYTKLPHSLFVFILLELTLSDTMNTMSVVVRDITHSGNELCCTVTLPPLVLKARIETAVALP